MASGHCKWSLKLSVLLVPLFWMLEESMALLGRPRKWSNQAEFAVVVNKLSDF
jgi:hypothetical protein